MERVYIEERAVELAHYIIDTKDTVRGAAKKFGVSKSTVHKDIAERLDKINPGLAKEAKKVLENKKAIRHIRGGEATRLKYKHRLATDGKGRSSSVGRPRPAQRFPGTKTDGKGQSFKINDLSEAKEVK